MDETTLMQTLMRHEADIAQQKELCETMTKTLTEIAGCVKIIADRMAAWKGFVAGAAATGALISGVIVWSVKTIPTSLVAAIK